MECQDCERLNEEEAGAGTDLVAAEQDWPRETFGPEYEAWRYRKEAAEARLKAARELRAAHRVWHQMSQ